MARGGNKPEAQKGPELTPEEQAYRSEGEQLTGDGGAREAEVSEAQAKFDAMHEQIDLGPDVGKVIENASSWVLDLFKHRPKSWDQLSQIEQRDLYAGIKGNVKELVRLVVEAVARDGREPVRCLFVGLTDKGDDIKLDLKVKANSVEETEHAVITLHRAKGKHVLLTLASADDYDDGTGVDRSEPDQPALGFEAGDDEHPADDSDLVDAAIEATEAVRHGDKLDVTGHRLPLTARINLKEGMVQGLPAGADELKGWVDIREATPAELATERERVSDFVGDEEEEDEAEQVSA